MRKKSKKKDPNDTPEHWKGPAFICPNGHQMHPKRMKMCIDKGFLDACCLNCGWQDQSLFIKNNKIRSRTEGRKVFEGDTNGNK